MRWTDSGVVLGVRHHGETGVLLDVLTRLHGRHAGYVHGGRSRRLRPVLQPGNAVDLEWHARVEEGLGTFAVEPLRLRAARVMGSAAALHAVNHLCALLRLLAEREPHGDLYEALDVLLDRIDDGARTPPALARFELGALREFGFGLDLACCAATGVMEELVFVSPRSARAVSRSAGEPYADRLLPLPSFLRAQDADPPSPAAVRDAFRLTGFFLERDVFGPRGLPLPDARAAYLRLLDPQ